MHHSLAKKRSKIVIVDWHESLETMQSLTDLDAEAILLNAMSRKVPDVKYGRKP
jgi:hypothetical protein